MKIILFRSNNIFDSRVNKYRNYYERAKIDYTIVGWDRKGDNWDKTNYDFFRYKAGEALGGLKAIKNHFQWMRFVYRYLTHHKEVTTIHACDLNSAYPAALYKCLHNKKVVLLFDACDWFSANFVENRFLQLVFDKMERFTYKWCDKLIICEPEREEQIKFKLREKPLVMPNIPEIDGSLITEVQDRFKFNNDYHTIAYMGLLSNNRFLLELLSLAEIETFNLLIAGYGNKEIMDKCIELNSRDNIKYFGRVNTEEGLNMENAADIIYAMYCKKVPNNVYAAPNKYYEALFLGKPLITTKGTIPGKKVESLKTGWSIDEDIEELRSLINSLSSEEIKEKGENAFKLWDKSFKQYINTFFTDFYSKVIR